jgi:hypothetical protein
LIVFDVCFVLCVIEGGGRLLRGVHNAANLAHHTGNVPPTQITVPSKSRTRTQKAFVRDVGDNILPSWTAIAQRRRAEPFTDAQRQWQLLRCALVFGLLRPGCCLFELPL